MRKPTIAGIVVIIVVIGLLAYPYPIEENAKEIPKETLPVSTIKEKPIEQSMEKQSESEISCVGNAMCFTGTVERIIDGDTLQIDGKRIRLSLTNTPEINEPGSGESTAFTRSLCPVGSKAQVDQDDLQPYDKYDRLLGKVICSGMILNAELLENNHAWILTQYCSTSEFSSEPWAKKFGCTQTVQMNEKQTSQSPTHITPTPTKEDNCDPSYPDVCIPPYPPDLNCSDIQYQNFRVLPPDPHRFDGDKDGIGCER